MLIYVQWKPYVEYLMKRIGPINYALRTVKKLVNVGSGLFAYFAYVPYTDLTSTFVFKKRCF